MVYGNIRRKSRSRSNSKSRKFSRRSRSRRSSQSRSSSRSLSRISGTVTHSKIRKKYYKSSRSRSRSRSFSRRKRSRSSRSKSTSRVRKLRSRSRSKYKTSRSRSRSCSFPRHKISILSRSRSRSRVRKLRSKSRSRSKSRPYKNTVTRSRSRSISRRRRSRSSSKSRYKKSISRSRSKSRCKKNRLSRSRSNSRSRKSRSESMSKSRHKKSRLARSRSTSRKRKTKLTHIGDSKTNSRSTSLKRGLKEQPKRRSKTTSPSRRDNEMVSVIKNEADKYKKVPSKEIEDDDDLQEIPVAPVTPPPLVDLASGSDEEGHKNEKQTNSQELTLGKEDLRIPLAFFNKKTISNVLGTSSKLKFNDAEPLGALSQVNISNDLLMPLTFGRKPSQTFVSSTQHQTVDLTENNTDLGPKTKNMSDKEIPSVYDMEDTISAGDTTIDLNLGRTAFLDSAIREKNGGKLLTDRKIERVIGSDSASLLPKNTMNLTPLKSTFDKPKVVLVKSPSIKNVNNAEDMNYIVKRRTIGQCAAAYLREGELVSTLRIFHEMGGELGIWQHPISAIYNQLLQLQKEGGDPRKYLNQNKDASDTLNLVKGHLESCLEDSKLGAVQRVVREELLHLISDIMGKSSPMPVECYGIRTDVLACSMLDEDPEEIKEFIHNTLIYGGLYEPTDEIISTIFTAVEQSQKSLLQGVTVEHSEERVIWLSG